MRINAALVLLILGLAIGGVVIWTTWPERPPARPSDVTAARSDRVVPEPPPRQAVEAVSTAVSPATTDDAGIGETGNDATLEWMIRAAEVPGDPRIPPDLAERVTRAHEDFTRSPDDPAWARRAERALADFLRTQDSGGRLQITSISCRAASCEVQAICFLAPGETWIEPADPGSARGAYPGDSPLAELRRDSGIPVWLGDRMGLLLSYVREPR